MLSDSDNKANRLSDFDSMPLAQLNADAKGALRHMGRKVSDPFLPNQNKFEEFAGWFGWPVSAGSRRFRQIREGKAGRRTLKKFFNKYEAWKEAIHYRAEVMRQENESELNALHERVRKLETQIAEGPNQYHSGGVPAYQDQAGEGNSP